MSLNNKQIKCLDGTRALSNQLRDLYGRILVKRKAWDENFETGQPNDLSVVGLVDQIKLSYGVDYQMVKEFYDQSCEKLLDFYDGVTVNGNAQYFKYIRNMSGG